MQQKQIDSRIERVLKFARQLAYAGDEEDVRMMKTQGPFRMMQQVAISLDGLRDAVRDYDILFEILKAEGYGEDENDGE